jgi:hypothetical protein
MPPRRLLGRADRGSPALAAQGDGRTYGHPSCCGRCRPTTRSPPTGPASRTRSWLASRPGSPTRCTRSTGWCSTSRPRPSEPSRGRRGTRVARSTSAAFLQASEGPPTAVSVAFGRARRPSRYTRAAPGAPDRTARAASKRLHALGSAPRPSPCRPTRRLSRRSAPSSSGLRNQHRRACRPGDRCFGSAGPRSVAGGPEAGPNRLSARGEGGSHKVLARIGLGAYAATLRPAATRLSPGGRGALSNWPGHQSKGCKQPLGCRRTEGHR